MPPLAHVECQPLHAWKGAPSFYANYRPLTSGRRNERAICFRHPEMRAPRALAGSMFRHVNRNLVPLIKIVEIAHAILLIIRKSGSAISLSVANFSEEMCGAIKYLIAQVHIYYRTLL